MNASKQKGTHGETRVLRFLKEQGFVSAHRKVLAGSRDTGDLQVTPWLIAEVKNHRTWSDGDLERWMVETEIEQGHAGARESVLIVLRFRQPIGRAYVIQRDRNAHLTMMFLGDWCEGYNL